MHVLVIAPGAPPKNAPEAIQVGRYLTELVKIHQVTLVTTPVERGWTRSDEGLELEPGSCARVLMQLPLHRWSARVLGSKYCANLFVPDRDFWIQYKSSSVLKGLSDAPDVIYSRSAPFSSALLARKIKQSTGCPWVMHLSDPWADSPYRSLSVRRAAIDQRLESDCVEAADVVTVTTQSQCDFYARKYSHLSERFAVSPNVLPKRQLRASTRRGIEFGERFTLVYAGALYGARRPTVLLDALHIIKKSKPCISDLISVVIAGNMTQDIRDEIVSSGFSNVHLAGALQYESAAALVRGADALISIEPDGSNELLATFFPSKLLDYMAAAKPILAVTPRESEAWKLCEAGYGLASQPGDAGRLARNVVNLVERTRRGEGLMDDANASYSERFTAGYAARKLDEIFRTIGPEHA